MGTDSMKTNENVYFRCRKDAAKYNDKLNSRESAADLLGVSVSSLADYELGNTKVVPVDKVVLMADLYNAPQLLNSYCAAECPIGCRKVIATELKSLQQTTISLLDLLADGKLQIYMNSLTHIAIDGRINDNERNKMTEIVQYGAIMPTKAHASDAGLDLYSQNYALVEAGGSAVFDTGVHVAIPEGYVGFLKSKSGLNVNHGITSEGVIDSGYTGSIKVKLYNNSKLSYVVSAGDKISQLVILPINTSELVLVKDLEETERGNNGFGSTGR